jgi:photosystem II stability/assembly factor-like uncharacterized protein
VGAGGTILKTTDGGTIWGRQASGLLNTLNAVLFPVNAQTGFAVGDSGILLRTSDGGGVGMEEEIGQGLRVLSQTFVTVPNPFAAYATVPGHESERFVLYDISGRRVGTYKGIRIGEGLTAGVYFLRPEDKTSQPVRIVKVR